MLPNINKFKLFIILKICKENRFSFGFEKLCSLDFRYESLTCLINIE